MILWGWSFWAVPDFFFKRKGLSGIIYLLVNLNTFFFKKAD